MRTGCAWAPPSLKNRWLFSFPPFWLPEQPQLPSRTSQLLPRLGGQNRSASQGDLVPHPAQSPSLPALVSLGGAGDHWSPRVAGPGGSPLLRCRGEQLKWAETPDSFG